MTQLIPQCSGSTLSIESRSQTTAKQWRKRSRDIRMWEWRRSGTRSTLVWHFTEQERRTASQGVLVILGQTPPEGLACFHAAKCTKLPVNRRNGAIRARFSHVSQHMAKLFRCQTIRTAETLINICQCISHSFFRPCNLRSVARAKKVDETAGKPRFETPIKRRLERVARMFDRKCNRDRIWAFLV